MEITTENAQETNELGKRIAADLVKNKSTNVILLNGELGAGKTTFVQGFAKSLGINDRVTSPTFILLREHEVSTHGFHKLYHLDLYRLEGDLEKTANELGLKEIANDPSNILLVEWADKLDKYFPKEAIEINIRKASDSQRKFEIKK